MKIDQFLEIMHLAERMKSMPTWAQISRERAEAQKKLAAERAQG